MWTAQFVGDDVQYTWIFFFLFTLLHLFCNYRAVNSVQLDVGN